MTSVPNLLPARSWPDLVFHVLAHVAGTAHLPASVFDPTYIRYAEGHLGPAEHRPLGEDAALLGQVLPTHELLARAQLLGWLFDEVEQAMSSSERDLAALEPSQFVRPQLLRSLVAAGPAVEVLRCAALLEHQAQAELPDLEFDEPALSAALAPVARAAPRLAACGLRPLRSLRLRGRLLGEEIWVGVPVPELALDVDHVAWQAGHEATVKEVGEVAGHPWPERQVEQVALVLLAERAAEAGLQDGHARWLGHFGEPGPSTARARLGPGELGLLVACRRGS